MQEKNGFKNYFRSVDLVQQVFCLLLISAFLGASNGSALAQNLNAPAASPSPSSSAVGFAPLVQDPNARAVQPPPSPSFSTVAIGASPGGGGSIGVVSWSYTLRVNDGHGTAATFRGFDSSGNTLVHNDVQTSTSDPIVYVDVYDSNGVYQTWFWYNRSIVASSAILAGLSLTLPEPWRTYAYQHSRFWHDTEGTTDDDSGSCWGECLTCLGCTAASVACASICATTVANPFASIPCLACIVENAACGGLCGLCIVCVADGATGPT